MDLRNNGTTKNYMENDKRTHNECQSREIQPQLLLNIIIGGRRPARLVAWGLNLKIWISCSDFLLPQSGKETKKEEKDRKGEREWVIWETATDSSSNIHEGRTEPDVRRGNLGSALQGGDWFGSTLMGWIFLVWFDLAIKVWSFSPHQSPYLTWT